MLTMLTRPRLNAVFGPLTLGIVVIGCGEADEKTFTVPDQPVEGRVAGMPWSMVDAYAEPDSFDEGHIRIELYSDEAFEPCENASGPQGHTLFFSVPAEPGTHELSFAFSDADMTATFYDGAGANVIAVEGVIEIESVTESEVAGGLNVEADGDNAAAGEFNAVRCTP